LVFYFVGAAWVAEGTSRLFIHFVISFLFLYIYLFIDLFID